MRKITGITLSSIAAWVIVIIALCCVAYGLGYIWGSKPVPDVVYVGDIVPNMEDSYELGTFSGSIAYTVLEDDTHHNYGNFLLGYMKVRWK